LAQDWTSLAVDGNQSGGLSVFFPHCPLGWRASGINLPSHSNLILAGLSTPLLFFQWLTIWGFLIHPDTFPSQMHDNGPCASLRRWRTRVPCSPACGKPSFALLVPLPFLLNRSYEFDCPPTQKFTTANASSAAFPPKPSSPLFTKKNYSHFNQPPLILVQLDCPSLLSSLFS